jgi:SAM-dependent methyltransferase
MSNARSQRADGYEGLREYSGGAYFDSAPDRHAEDAAFKVQHFLRLFGPAAAERHWCVRSYADVGCGAGVEVRAVLHGLRGAGYPVAEAWGYDIHPGVGSIASDDEVHFVRGDFTRSGHPVDLVTLFDVFEHVPDPIGFLRSIAERCRYLGLHIPLDNCVSHSLRDRYGAKLRNPGHLVFLDACHALNLLSYAGLRAVRYAYAPGFRAPSGGESALARFARLPRSMVWRISPWLLSKTLGGCSLLVLAETPTGWSHGL